MIKIEGYSDKYRDGVLACLKRHYRGMAKMDDLVLYKWLSPIIQYSWQNDISIKDCPFKYGAILLDDETVVGFLGLIYSYQEQQGNRYVYLTSTTWAVDEDYRIYLFKIIKKVYSYADVISDFSPITSIKEVLIKIFKFKYLDKSTLIFLPIPYLTFSKIKCIFIYNKNAFYDEKNKMIYENHKKYGVKCIEIKYRNENSCIFYTVAHKEKKGIKFNWIHILYVENSNLFAKNAHEIIWRLQKKEHAFLNCDKRFFGNNNICYPKYWTKSADRLYLNKMMKNEIKVDLLYSEYAMLGI